MQFMAFMMAQQGPGCILCWFSPFLSVPVNEYESDLSYKGDLQIMSAHLWGHPPLPSTGVHLHLFEVERAFSRIHRLNYLLIKRLQTLLECKVHEYQ